MSTFCYNAWGMFVGQDIDDETETGQLLLRNNEFHSNVFENISKMNGDYEFSGQRVQPWRLGWSEV